MRSPWQVLKGFASRSKAYGASERPDEAEDSLRLTREEPQTDESTRPQGLPDLTHSDTDTVSIRVSIAAEEPKAPAQKQRTTVDSPSVGSEVSSAHVDAPTPELVDAKVSPRNIEPAPAKADAPVGNPIDGNLATRAVETSSEIGSLDHDPRQSNKTPIVDQAMALDVEISELRERLAEKLRAQNSHLRKLLDRYDR